MAQTATSILTTPESPFGQLVEHDVTITPIADPTLEQLLSEGGDMELPEIDDIDWAYLGDLT